MLFLPHVRTQLADLKERERKYSNMMDEGDNLITNNGTKPDSSRWQKLLITSVKNSM